MFRRPTEQLEPVLQFMHRQFGLTFASAQRRHALAEIRKAMMEEGFEPGQGGQFLRAVKEDARVREELVQRLTTRETFFKRDDQMFRVLESSIIPSLLKSRPAGRARFWSAGSASGEEAYSLAIVRDQLGLTDRVSILGTDICETALQQARRGIYRAWSLRGNEDLIAEGYLSPVGNSFRIADRLRQNLDFAHLNLVADPYPTSDGKFDLILCRNVLIYFDAPTQHRVIRRLVASLAEGGYLVLGACDPLAYDDSLVKVVRTEAGLVYCRRVSSDVSIHVKPMPAPSRPTTQARRIRRWRAANRPVKAEVKPTLKPAPKRESLSPAAEIEQLCNAGEFQRALDKAEQAIEQTPSDPQLHLLHAVVLMELDRDDQAREAIRRVRYLDPQSELAAAARMLLDGRAESYGSH